MAKKRGGAHGGHGWFVTFADLMGLMMSFFVMLVACSTMDNEKLKLVAGSMRDAFGVQSAARFSGVLHGTSRTASVHLYSSAIGAVAQLGEHRVCNAGVGGSSPLGSISSYKLYKPDNTSR